MLTDRLRAKKIRWLSLSIGVGLSLILLGCSREPPPPQLTPTPPQGAPQAPDEQTPEEAKAAARQVVSDYLEALYAREYEKAYDYLSKASREAHSRDALRSGAPVLLSSIQFYAQDAVLALRSAPGERFHSGRARRVSTRIDATHVDDASIRARRKPYG